MQPYLQVFKITILEYLVYRLNFILWRFRVVLSLLVIYFLWSSFFENTKIILGYSQEQMLTYILLAGLTSNFVLASRTQDVAGEILNGSLINYVLRPVSFFRYIATRDLADKLINLSFTIVEIGLIVLLLKPLLFVQTGLVNYLLFDIFLLLGIGTAFFINLTISFIGFWTPEVWAPRFIFFMIVFFLSGAYFPLDILPERFYNLLLLTPFPYLYYLPTRAYLGISTHLIPFYLIASLSWFFITYYLCALLWRKGLRGYSYYGR